VDWNSIIESRVERTHPKQSLRIFNSSVNLF
jgi:hypothetical protein